MVKTTRSELGSVREAVLYVAFELGKKEWKLAMTSGFEVAPWVRSVAGGDLPAVARALAQGRHRFGLSAEAGVVSCYEAGRDGFWVHRALTTLGLANRVVDSSSIEVNRRARRTKTDRTDAIKLVRMLVRVCAGERGVWHEVRVPPARVEAARQVSRERAALVREQTRLRNQISGWLATGGCTVSATTLRPAEWWTRVRDWQQTPLAPELQARLARADARLRLLREQLATLDAQQAAATRAAAPDSALGRLVQLKGVATTSAAVLLAEGLEWRAFRNRREIGGLLGFAPAHYTSGETTRDQGISRAGNARLQAISIELAWNWVRWQPLSALTVWYHQHFGPRRRARRIGIVALARKLLIALWRYVTTGVVPAGAMVKPLSVG
jgi:transposase